MSSLGSNWISQIPVFLDIRGKKEKNLAYSSLWLKLWEPLHQLFPTPNNLMLRKAAVFNQTGDNHMNGVIWQNHSGLLFILHASWVPGIDQKCPSLWEL